MKKLFTLSALALCISAQAASFDCKPKWILNGTGTKAIAHSNELGRVIFWFCPGKKLNMVIRLKDFTSPAFENDFDLFIQDPSHARMNQMLTKYSTLDPYSSEGLKIWTRYQTEIDSLKATSN